MKGDIYLQVHPDNIGWLLGVSRRDGRRHGVQILEQLKMEVR